MICRIFVCHVGSKRIEVCFFLPSDNNTTEKENTRMREVKKMVKRVKSAGFQGKLKSLHSPLIRPGVLLMHC